VLASPVFWLLVVTYFVCGFQDFYVSTHVVALASDRGASPMLAGNALALMGVMGVLGVLLSGWMADAFGAVRPMALSFLLRIAIFLYVLYVQTPWALFAFAMLYGFTFFITAPLIPLLVRQFFGSQRLGTISGVISMVHQLAGGLGAFAGGALFDRFGSYQWAFVLVLGMALAATVSSLLVRSPRPTLAR
jgi:predicted MFS family arabinose efflux permease